MLLQAGVHTGITQQKSMTQISSGVRNPPSLTRTLFVIDLCETMPTWKGNIIELIHIPYF